MEHATERGNPSGRLSLQQRMEIARQVASAKRAVGLPGVVTSMEMEDLTGTYSAIRAHAGLPTRAEEDGGSGGGSEGNYLAGVRSQIAELKASTKGGYTEPRSASEMYAALRQARAFAEGNRADKYQCAETCIGDACDAAPTRDDENKCLSLSGKRGWELISGIDTILGE